MLVGHCCAQSSCFAFTRISLGDFPFAFNKPFGRDYSFQILAM